MLGHDPGEVRKFTPGGAPVESWPVPGFPVGLSVDGDSNLYVALNRGAGPIRKYSTTGEFLAEFPYAAFKSAVGPDGAVYTVDYFGDRVWKIAPDGTLLGEFGGLRGNDGLQLDGPTGVAVDAAGTIYVADEGNRRVQAFSPRMSTSG